MKKFVLMFTLCVTMQVVHAQKLKEWLKQNKTQIEYLLNQIAALAIHIHDIKKGNSIAKIGTDLITDIKHKDYNQHNDYFNSLKTVSSTVKNDSKIAVTIANQAAILQLFTQLIDVSVHSDFLTNEEITYIKQVYSHLNTESEKDLDQLTLVITSGDLEMKEDERIRAINSLYDKVKDKLSFAKVFCHQTMLLVQQRSAEALETQRQKKMMGLN